MSRFSISRFSIVLALTFSLIIAGNNQQWRKGVIIWDIISYYAYLPATFIYNDLTFAFLDQNKDPEVIVWTSDTEDKKRYIKMTCGLSIMYSPFFFMAHGIAKLQPEMYAPNGYSMVYSLFLILSTIFYATLGLIFLRKILIRYFSDMIAGITILSVFIGTNMFYYTVYEVMPHTYLFCLITMFIYFTIRWYESKKMLYTVLLGLLTGLIVLIRPVDILVILLFIFYDITTISDFKNRIHYLLKSKGHILIMALFTFGIFFIQMSYWKLATGHWIYWSYSEEGFFWLKPHIINGLIGFRKGWYIYTPLMLLATIGLFLLRKTEKRFFIPFILFFSLYTYVIFSWWCWWYGGGLSCRPMIDIYGVMAIGLASFLTYVMANKNIVIKYASLILVCIFTCYSIFGTMQYTLGILHYDSMTFTSWKKGFLKISIPGDYYDAMSAPNYDKALKEGNE